MTDSSAFVVELWLRSLQQAYGLARGARLNELHGKRVRRYDDRGMDPYSEVWGKIHAYEDMEPILGLSCIATSPSEMRTQAAQDAFDEFALDLRLGMVA